MKSLKSEHEKLEFMQRKAGAVNVRTMGEKDDQSDSVLNGQEGSHRGIREVHEEEVTVIKSYATLLESFIFVIKEKKVRFNGERLDPCGARISKDWTVWKYEAIERQESKMTSSLQA